MTVLPIVRIEWIGAEPDCQQLIDTKLDAGRAWYRYSPASPFRL